MFGVTQRFLANLPMARWVPRVEWSRDGATWLAADMTAGSVSADANRRTRWELDATLTGVDVGKNAFSPYGVLMRAFLGLAYSLTDVEWVPLGVYRAQTVDRTLTGRGNIAVKGHSYEAALFDAGFYSPRVFERQDGRTLVQTLTREVIPTAGIRWSVPPLRTPQVAAEAAKGSRWKVIEGDSDEPSIARALGARYYADARGHFVMAPVPTLADDPVWTAEVGDGGLLYEAAETLTRDDVYNVIVTRGTSSSDAPPAGPGIARDNDPHSPTYVGRPVDQGGFGESVRYFSSQYLTTQAQCDTAALGMLQPHLGLRQQARLEAFNPALHPDDVIDARMPDGSLQPNVIESIDLDLMDPAAGMSIGVRSAQTRLTGSLYALPEQSGGE